MTGFSPVQPEVCGTGRVESPGKVPIPLSSKYTWVSAVGAPEFTEFRTFRSRSMAKPGVEHKQKKAEKKVERKDRGRPLAEGQYVISARCVGTMDPCSQWPG